MRKESLLAEKIRAVVEPSVKDLGYRMVLIRTEGAGRGKSLVQILAEPLKGGNITLDECAKLSRTISMLLDVSDPISGTYTLEVSSPGIDRPLVSEEDLIKHIGYEAKVEVESLIDNRRRFKGRIKSVEGGKVVIFAEDGEFSLPIVSILSAKLVLNDELLKVVKTK